MGEVKKLRTNNPRKVAKDDNPRKLVSGPLAASERPHPGRGDPASTKPNGSIPRG